MTIKNAIDIILQAAPSRTLTPDVDPVPLGISVVENTNGTRDITLTWQPYNHGLITADKIGILWNESTTAIPVAPTLLSNSGYVVLDLEAISYAFKGVDPTKYYRMGIVAAKITDVGNNHTNIISPISAPDWRVTAGVPNYTANVGGLDIDTLLAGIDYVANDGIIEPREKTSLRAVWDSWLGERSGIIAQATTLSISTEINNYSSKFQLLANFLNAGSTWSSGYPYYINDTQKDSNTDISAVGRDAFKAVVVEFAIAKQALINKMADKASAMSTWTGTINKPLSLYSTDEANRLGLNPTFSAWAGPYPDNWVGWSSNPSIVRETSIVRYENAVRVTGVSGVDSGLTVIPPGLKFPANATVTLLMDVYIVSRTSGYPGVYIDDGIALQFGQAASATVGVWQTISVVFRTSAAPTRVQIMIPGYWALVGAFVGTAIYGGFTLDIKSSADFDNKKQQATDVLFTAGQFNAATALLNGSLTAAKTAIAAIDPNSGNLTANSVTANNINVANLAAITANLGTVTAGNVDTVGYVKANGYFASGLGHAAMVANDSYSQPLGLVSYGSNSAVYGTGFSNGNGGFFIGSGSGHGVYAQSNGASAAVYADAGSGYAIQANGSISCNDNIQCFTLNGESIGSYALTTENYIIHTNATNNIEIRWNSDGGSGASVIGKTHTHWARMYIDGSLFYIPLFQ